MTCLCAFEFSFFCVVGFAACFLKLWCLFNVVSFSFCVFCCGFSIFWISSLTSDPLFNGVKTHGGGHDSRDACALDAGVFLSFVLPDLISVCVCRRRCGCDQTSTSLNSSSQSLPGGRRGRNGERDSRSCLGASVRFYSSDAAAPARVNNRWRLTPSIRRRSVPRLRQDNASLPHASGPSIIQQPARNAAFVVWLTPAEDFFAASLWLWFSLKATQKKKKDAARKNSCVRMVKKNIYIRIGPNVWKTPKKTFLKKSSIIVKWHDLTLSNLLWQKVWTDFPHWLSP